MENTENKSSEQLLKESEEKYRGLYNSIRDSILVADTNRNIIDYNPAFCSLFGYSKEEIIGKQTVYVYENESEFKAVGEAIKAHYGDKPFLKTVNYKKKSGEIFPGETNVFYLKNDKGEVSGFIGLIRDVTERKQAEELLKLTELKFRTFADYTSDWEYWEDTHNKIMYMSPSCERITGYTQDEFISKPELLTSIVHPEDVDSVIKHHAESYNYQDRNHIYEIEFRAIKKDNSTINIHHTCRPIFDGDKKFLGRRVSNRDITERKKAEIEIKNKEKQFRAIVESAGDAMFLADYESKKIILANQQACKSLGYTNEELLNLKVMQLDPNYLTEKEIEKIWDTMEIDEPITIETNHKRKDGSIFPVEVKTVKIIYNKKKTILGFVRDITERKKAEETLQLTQASVDRLTDAIYWMRSDAKLIYVNDAAVKALGYSKEELLTMTAYDFGPKMSAEMWPRHWSQLKEKNYIIFQTIHQRKDGSTFPVEITANFLQFGDKEINCAIAKDITERKKAEEELTKYSKHLEELVKERTLEIDEKNQKLSDQMRIFVGRELKIRNLESKIKALQGK